MADIQSQPAQQVIRFFNQRLGLASWGFVTYRCTYSSQEKWDKFMSLLKQEAQQFLHSDSDSDLRSSLIWTVIEDEDNLDGVEYPEARTLHDQWVREEIQRDIDHGTARPNIPAYMSGLGEFHQRIRDQPRYEFFIFADEEVVNSVVDAHEANQKDRQGLFYFIKVVRTGIVEKFEEDEDEDEEDEEEEYDEDDGDARRFVWQKFKAWDVVRLYASILRGGWPDHHAEMYGVCDIFGP